MTYSTSESMINKVVLHNVARQTCHRYEDVLICGDLRDRTIDWDYLQCGSECQKFVDLTVDYFHHQHINEPIRS